MLAEQLWSPLRGRHRRRPVQSRTRGPDERRCNDLPKPSEPNAQAGRTSVDHEVFQSRVAAGYEDLRKFDYTSECHKAQSQQPPSSSVAYAEGQTEQDMSKKVLRIVAELSNRPV
jgi:hypothetical protein